MPPPPNPYEHIAHLEASFRACLAHNENLQRILQSRDIEIHSKTQAIADLHAVLRAREQAITTSEKASRETSQRIANLQVDLEILARTNVDLEKQSADKDETLRALRNKAAEAPVDHDQMSKRLDKTIGDLEEKEIEAASQNLPEDETEREIHRLKSKSKRKDHHFSTTRQLLHIARHLPQKKLARLEDILRKGQRALDVETARTERSRVKTISQLRREVFELKRKVDEMTKAKDEAVARAERHTSMEYSKAEVQKAVAEAIGILLRRLGI